MYVALCPLTKCAIARRILCSAYPRDKEGSLILSKVELSRFGMFRFKEACNGNPLFDPFNKHPVVVSFQALGRSTNS